MTTQADPLVIEVFQAGDKSYFKVAQSKSGVSSVATVFEARIGESPYIELKNRPLKLGLGLMQKCGDHLCTKLASNAGVNETLTGFQNPGLGQRYPIYISISEPEHEKLPWEAIWRDKFDFLALGQHWPIARLTSATDDIKPRVKEIGPRPKILAVIAAEGADDATEWNGFEKLIELYPDKFDMHVLLASDEIADRVSKVAAGNPNIGWSFVGSAAEVMQRLRIYRPNIVHFFCHGTSEKGGYLSLIQRLGDSIEIGIADLRQLGEIETVCLVVLNCCLGGDSDPDDQSGSIARELVKKGLPAVVAMREIVSDQAANSFAAAFYGELLNKFLAAVAGSPVNGAIVVGDDIWLEALFQGRQALKGAAPDDLVEWTLPLIYLRRGGLLLQTRVDSGLREPEPLGKTIGKAEDAASSTKASEEAVLRDVRKMWAAQPNTPPALLKEIDDRIAALRA